MIERLGKGASAAVNAVILEKSMKWVHTLTEPGGLLAKPIAPIDVVALAIAAIGVAATHFKNASDKDPDGDTALMNALLWTQLQNVIGQVLDIKSEQKLDIITKEMLG